MNETAKKEHAAKTLENELYLLFSNGSEHEIQLALQVAIRALRGLDSHWVSTSDRLPTAEDAGLYGYVVYCGFWKNGYYIELRKWHLIEYRRDDEEKGYWVALPKLPEVEE